MVDTNKATHFRSYIASAQCGISIAIIEVCIILIRHGLSFIFNGFNITQGTDQATDDGTGVFSIDGVHWEARVNNRSSSGIFARSQTNQTSHIDSIRLTNQGTGSLHIGQLATYHGADEGTLVDWIAVKGHLSNNILNRSILGYAKHTRISVRQNRMNARNDVTIALKGTLEVDVVGTNRYPNALIHVNISMNFHCFSTKIIARLMVLTIDQGNDPS